MGQVEESNLTSKFDTHQSVLDVDLYIPHFDPEKVDDVLADEDRYQLTQEEIDYYAEQFSKEGITMREMGDLLMEIEDKGVITQTERRSMCNGLTPLYSYQGEVFTTVFSEPCNPQTHISYYEENNPSFTNQFFEAAYDRVHYLDNLENFCRNEQIYLSGVQNSLGQSISEERDTINTMQNILNGIMAGQSKESKENVTQNSRTSVSFDLQYRMSNYEQEMATRFLQESEEIMLNDVNPNNYISRESLVSAVT